jgi:hypothetical protein
LGFAETNRMKTSRSRFSARVASLMAAAVLVCAIVFVPAAGAGAPATTLGSSKVAHTTSAPPLWGIAGSYQGVAPSDLARRGIGFGLVDLIWSGAEPQPGVFDEGYFAAMRAQIKAFRKAGLKIVLGSGIEEAPAWLLNMPDARFVDQDGVTYTGSNEPNLIFATQYRPLAAAYLAKVFQELGTNFYAVRVGGGHWNELTYPSVFTNGHWEDDYWAFDGAAMQQNPVPTWRPGMAGGGTAPAKFLTWYLQSLTNYELWQIATVRRSYPGTIAVLDGSWGLRQGDFAKIVATNLNGTSSPEQNGEAQVGSDHAQQIAAIKDKHVAVWITWVNNANVASWLSGLARKQGLQVMGENGGSNTPAQMTSTLAIAERNHLSAFMWVRASEAYCNCDGFATIDQYTSGIKSINAQVAAQAKAAQRLPATPK